MKQRWAKQKGKSAPKKAAPAKPKARPTMNAAARKKLSDLMKARWAAKKKPPSAISASPPLALMPKDSRLRSSCDDGVGTEQARPGTYVLVLSSRSTDLIQVGRLGALQLQSGFYVYVGSALGPGGVHARLAHHRKLSLRPHWHIDYLRLHTRVEGIWYRLDDRRLEHAWAEHIKSAKGAAVPLVGFGSTDCGCESHLFFFEQRFSRERFRQVLGTGIRTASCSHRRT